MKGISAALWSEGLKIRRSKILWFTILFFMFIPLMIGLILFVVKNPVFAGKLGMIGTKATMIRFGKADWLTYFELVNQIIAAVGLIGFGFVTSWVFGREYSDRTVKDLLALPVSRSSIVLSKFIAVAVWCALLSFVLFVFSILIGGMLHLSGWSLVIIFQSACKFAITSLLTILLCTPVAFFASCGRGYLLPMGIVIITLITANFTGLVGLAPYFPWAIPGIYSVPAGTERMQLGIVSYIILMLTCVLGLLGTLTWWRFADQT